MFLGVANLGQCTAWAMPSPRSVLCQDGSAVAPLRCMDSRVLKDFASFPFWFVFWFYFKNIFSAGSSPSRRLVVFFFFIDAVSVLLILSGFVALPDVKHLRSLFETITKLHDRQAIN